MNLVKVQSMSFLSRLGTMVVGNIFQSLIVLTFLSQEEYGMVALIASIVSIIGASQAFGLSSGSTRELSNAKTIKEAKKIFLTSLILRFLISTPFALILFLKAGNLSLNSSNPEIMIFALRITALVMFFEPLRGIFNSVISAFQQFKILFLYQFVIALVSIVIYAPLLYLFAFRGYYIAYFIFSLTATLVLCVLALKNFNGVSANFSIVDFLKYSKDLFTISIGIYFIKVLFSAWISGPAIYFYYTKEFTELSLHNGNTELTIAIFSLALLFATKLLVISDSITDVTLPVNSKKFVEDSSKFKIDYKQIYIKTSFVIALVCSVFAFFNFEIINILSSIVQKNYSESSQIIPLVVIGILFYSNIDLLKSSVLIPAKKIIGMLLIHVFLVLTVYFVFFVISNFFRIDSLVGFSIAFALSAVLSYILTLFYIFISMKYFISNLGHLLFLFVNLLFIISYYLFFQLFLIKIIMFTVYLIFSIVFYKLLTKRS